MRKTIIASAIAAASLVAVPAAFGQTFDQSPAPTHHDGWFVNGQAGRTHMNHHWNRGHDTGYQLTGGYRWAVGSSSLIGIEGGYNDLGNIKVSKAVHKGDVVDYSRSKLRGWMLGGTGHFNLTPNWYVAARAGLYQWKGEGLSNNKNPLHRSLDDTDWYGGVGFGYDFSNNMSVGLDYDYYHAKKHHVNLTTDMISVNAEYRF